MLITAIETIRAVAHRAAEDPQPPAAADPPTTGSFPVRLWRLLIRLLDAEMPEGRILQVLWRALRALLPLLTFDPPPADPPVDPPEPPVKTRARIDLLRQERAARARERQAGELHACARPDRPPAPASAFVSDTPGEPDGDLWNDLLDLTSESVEVFVLSGDAEGVGRCAELLDLLSETFAEEHPEVHPKVS